MGQLQERFAHGAVELLGLLLHAGLRGPGEAGFDVDIDENGAVRDQSAAGDAVEVVDGIGAEATAGALVGERGVCESIAQYDFPCGERRQDHFVDVLCTAGEHQQKFGGGLEVGAGVVEQQLADLCADAGAAGFLGFDDVASGGAEAVGEELELC